MLTTKFLIMNEGTVDWEELSNNPERSFSLAEIRIFRKRINWENYLKEHEMSSDEMEIASKFFTPHVYNLIALNNLASQEFILKHRDNFNWNILLANSYLTEETILTCAEKINLEKAEIKTLLEKNKLIDLKSEEYEDLLLYLKL